MVFVIDGAYMGDCEMNEFHVNNVLGWDVVLHWMIGMGKGTE